MPRDFESLYRAQAQARTSTVQNETISLPPGYLVGYDVRLRQDYTVVITAGAANIGGRLVQITEDHQLADADWVAPKINSSRHYYIYLSAAGQWFVDIVAPVWNNQYLYWEQPDTNWRAVGKIFLADGNIIFAIKEVEKNEQTVTVAPAGFTGRADYYCTGTDDQILINAAIRYLHEAYDGGECKLLKGTFECDDVISLDYDNTSLTGDGLGSNIHGNNNANYNRTIDIGDGLTYIPERCSVKDIRLSGNVDYGIVGSGTDSTVDGVFVSEKTIALNLTMARIKVINCDIDGSSIGTVGIQIGSANAIVTNNKIHGLLGDGPQGITTDNLFPEAIITDNYIYDVVGNTAGIAYGIRSQGNRDVVSRNRITTVSNTDTASNVYAIYTSGSNSKVTDNYCYNNGSDTGIANTNQDNFYDAGTDTQVYSNSWQQPVAGEPTQGELKWLPQATGTTVYAVLNATTTAAWSSVSMGSLIPAGTKSVYATIVVQASSSGAGLYRHYVAFSNDYSATPAAGTTHPKVGVVNYAAGAGELSATFDNLAIPIDSGGKFYYYAYSRLNASNCVAACYLTGYTI